jgi:molybdenum cofactor cytidylyltransferase
MPGESVHAVMLAAGASERMGRDKLLMEVGGMTILEISLANHLESSLDGVSIVVPGWVDGFKAIAAGTADDRAVFIETDRPGDMSASLKVGWSWARDNTESRGIMISLADQPLVGRRTIDLLVKTYLESDMGFCVPTYRGLRGHPVIVGREFDSDVMQLSGDRGAREIMARRPGLVLEVEVASDEVVLDLDRIEDFEAIRSRIRSRG